MFKTGKLTHCQQRKYALLGQSAAHRRTLLAQGQNIRPVADCADLGIDVARKI